MSELPAAAARRRTSRGPRRARTATRRAPMPPMRLAHGPRRWPPTILLASSWRWSDVAAAAAVRMNRASLLERRRRTTRSSVDCPGPRSTPDDTVAGDRRRPPARCSSPSRSSSSSGSARHAKNAETLGRARRPRTAAGRSAAGSSRWPTSCSPGCSCSRAARGPTPRPGGVGRCAEGRDGGDRVGDRVRRWAPRSSAASGALVSSRRRGQRRSSSPAQDIEDAGVERPASAAVGFTRARRRGAPRDRGRCARSRPASTRPTRRSALPSPWRNHGAAPPPARTPRGRRRIAPCRRSSPPPPPPAPPPPGQETCRSAGADSATA